MYEKLSVIPLYLGFVRIYDSKFDHAWDEQVAFSLSYADAANRVRGAMKGGFPDTASVQGIIKYYHIKPNGEICFINWDPV